MDILTKAIGGLTTAGRNVSQKASEVSAITKASVKVADDERDLREIFRQLGQEFYENYPDEARVYFAGIVQKIEKRKIQLEIDREELAKLRNKKFCPHCGSIIARDSLYCMKCGKNVEEIIVQEEIPSSDVQADGTNDEEVEIIEGTMIEE